jgi:hypothetical protein
MSLFEDAKPVRNQHRKVTPYYQVIVIGDEDNAYNHEPGCTVEAVPVGNEAHYVVKKANGTIDAMYPFSSVLSIELIEEEDQED